MASEPDYKAAYETLVRAIDKVESILYVAQLMASIRLRMEIGEKVDREEMDAIKNMINSE